MAINVNNPQADALTRKFASVAGVSITDAIVIAMKEALERRLNLESATETAARLRAKHGLVLSARGKEPLPRSVFDEMWDGK
ncbi:MULTISPECIES: type II toxin-antitoxin system VapB family antitoxin [Rhizobium]|uniref:Type II toxin-antitoxin system VapB family antitoxin n=1 Tax=Rhizobium rhododendri TaxID=2506430 RepID=A0ABY8IQR1_9HYPH|nr:MULTISPECIES: type II toxin-antitoxin system VapB family antitoxin [Rhizobium]MBO9101364.1 type II toxin-antitoxin system VapB family antitoxin [Rhizobium sp. L58/93]MBO9134981.1 type II toxin-antitoxin system VapB family antitoxin [Rhizobium sp. B209b/85]MBO9171072.1 type II toxin-antitoxin system VapB family antitoxin [Rhizobium sp. L245/93]MBO9186973.1 type II toxin-antitoxin system VapB family antitoxin [Rhizobium sp. E27B/91]QXZ81093.1 type II toxin-antitoxin system VapB family antitox